jgi:hypothetical protein
MEKKIIIIIIIIIIITYGTGWFHYVSDRNMA